MVVRNTLLSAMCVAGLLSVASVGTANAAAQLIPNQLIYQSSPGGTVYVYGDAKTTGTMFTSGITITGLTGTVTGVGLPLAPTPKTQTNILLAILNAGSLGGDATLSFTSTGGPASATVTIVVPEPSTVAFGVIAAGSVAGLVLRKRRKAA